MKKILSWALPLVILATMAGLLWWAASTDSTIVDEAPHITAGYSYLRFGNSHINPEHPPLIKDLAALPVLFLNPNFPVTSPAWTTNTNDQWTLSHDFLWESGNDGHAIILWGRVGPMLVTLLLGLLLFYWIWKIGGYLAGIIALILYAFSPTVLGQGHLITTDVGAALGVLAGSFFFIRYLKRPSWKTLVAAGVIFGLAQLTKFSVFLLVPFFFLLVFVWWLARTDKSWKSLGKLVLATIGIETMGALVILLWYTPHVWNYAQARQLQDAQSILASFPIHILTWLDLKLISIRFLRPLGQFLLGLMMVLQRSEGGNTTYFLGQTTNSGWWYYFPVIYVLKEQAAFLILAALMLGASIFDLWRAQALKLRGLWQRIIQWSGENFELFTFIAFIVIYVCYSLNSTLNIGIRHLMPVLPLAYALVSVKASAWIQSSLGFTGTGGVLGVLWYKFKGAFTFGVKSFAVGGLLTWYVAAAFVAAPFFLPYFNTFAGGTAKGYTFAVDSNYDWGQDLYRLRQFVDKNSIDTIGVDYFGGGDPRYELGTKFQQWHSDMPPYPGKWFAVSATFIQQLRGTPVKGYVRQNPNEYSWLLNKKPYARAGYSIFIYKLK